MQAAVITVTAAALYLAIVMAMLLDSRYLRTRFTLPAYGCPIAIIRYHDPVPWCDTRAEDMP